MGDLVVFVLLPAGIAGIAIGLFGLARTWAERPGRTTWGVSGGRQGIGAVCERRGHRWEEMPRQEVLAAASRLDLPFLTYQALKVSPHTHGRRCTRCPFFDFSDREGWEITDRSERIEVGR